MSPRYSKEGMVIDISKVGRGRKADFSVSGVCIEKGIKQSYAIEYMPWSEWLGCEVDKQVFKKMPKEEIVAHYRRISLIIFQSSNYYKYF